MKKRVERDRDDYSYVITTYEGVHNHESPFTTYYSPKKMNRTQTVSHSLIYDTAFLINDSVDSFA